MNAKNVPSMAPALRKLADSADDHKLIFRYLASSYKKNMRLTYVDNLAQGAAVSEVAARGFFKKLQDMGLGKLLIGRRGHRTRFEWDAPLTAVAQAAQGKQISDEDLKNPLWRAELTRNRGVDPDDDSAPEDGGEGTQGKIHRYPLRRDFEALLTLPADITAKDVERLCAYLKTLPLD